MRPSINGRGGQWKVSAGVWVQPDCAVGFTAAEGLSEDFRLGKQEFILEIGIACFVLSRYINCDLTMMFNSRWGVCI